MNEETKTLDTSAGRAADSIRSPLQGENPDHLLVSISEVGSVLYQTSNRPVSVGELLDLLAPYAKARRERAKWRKQRAKPARAAKGKRGKKKTS